MAKIKTVCLVDDSAGMRKMGVNFLTREGPEIITAKDGYDALHVIRKYQPDACFIDLEMPNLDGLKLVSILRANSAYENMPIAILSSASSPFDKAKAALCGANQYLTKPLQQRRH